MFLSAIVMMKNRRSSKFNLLLCLSQLGLVPPEVLSFMLPGGHQFPLLHTGKNNGVGHIGS